MCDHCEVGEMMVVRRLFMRFLLNPECDTFVTHYAVQNNLNVSGRRWRLIKTQQSIVAATSISV